MARLGVRAIPTFTTCVFDTDARHHHQPRSGRECLPLSPGDASRCITYPSILHHPDNLSLSSRPTFACFSISTSSCIFDRISVRRPSKSSCIVIFSFLLVVVTCSVVKVVPVLDLSDHSRPEVSRLCCFSSYIIVYICISLHSTSLVW